MIGRIYKITSDDNKNELYIGSTFQNINRRFRGHCDGFQKYKDSKAGFVSSYDLLGKYLNCKIELIEEIPVENKGEILKHEARHIKEHRGNGFNVVNRHMPYLSDEERVDYNKRALAKYRENNREKYNEKLRKFMSEKYKNNSDYMEKHKRAMLDLYRFKKEANKLMAIEI